jgi:hypothetical protein
MLGIPLVGRRWNDSKACFGRSVLCLEGQTGLRFAAFGMGSFGLLAMPRFSLALRVETAMSNVECRTRAVNNENASWCSKDREQVRRSGLPANHERAEYPYFHSENLHRARTQRTPGGHAFETA